MPGSPTTTEREPVAARSATTSALLVVVAVAAAVGAVTAHPHPTASRPADVVVTVIFALAVVASAVGAGPRARCAAAAVAAVGAVGWPLPLALGTVALTTGAWRAPARSPVRLVGAVVGAALVQVLLRMPTDRTARNLFIGAVVVAILSVSAHRAAGAASRARVRRLTIVAGAAIGVATVGFAVALVLARADVQRGIDHADAGLDAARDGQGDEAARLLHSAGGSFASAHDQLDAWWTQPARWVPGVGPHARALEVLADEGSQLASASAESARAARIDEVRVTDGRLDLDQVRALEGPLADAQVALAAAARGVVRAESPWLVGPLADRVGAFEDDIGTATEEAITASEAVEVLPALLGGDGPRRYFVAFGTPSETRELGGFMGAYGILEADDGELSLRSTGRVRNLNVYFLGGQLGDPSAFPDHYLAMRPEKFWQNLPGTPDFPTAAAAFDQLWQSRQSPLDGMLYLDPQALAMLLELTGPIRLEGYDTPLTTETAADFLERGQYVEFPDDDRHDFLVDAASTVFERLTDGELPGPRELADTLGPAVRQRRLLLNSFRPEEQALFQRLDVDGSLPPVSGDFLSVRSSNRGRSKIDAFMERTITYEVHADPATGAVRSTVTVEIANRAPSSGLPDPVIGNHLDRPTGTSSTTVSVYTPLDLVDVLIEGASTGRGASQAYGRNRFSALVDIAPGDTQTVTFELEGTMDLSDGYHLDVVPQALVHPDDLVFRIALPDGWVAGGRATTEVALEEDEHVDVSFFSFGRG